jgi:DNA-binding transcriptional ArsR family regulator
VDHFAALADPNRRRILEMLGEGSRPAGAIAAEFELTAPAVSQHLKALRQAGLVRVEVDGTRRIYSLHPDGLAAVEDWLVRMRGFWSGRLDALERALEAEKGEGE